MLSVRCFFQAFLVSMARLVVIELGSSLRLSYVVVSELLPRFRNALGMKSKLPPDQIAWEFYTKAREQNFVSSYLLNCCHLFFIVNCFSITHRLHIPILVKMYVTYLPQPLNSTYMFSSIFITFFCLHFLRKFLVRLLLFIVSMFYTILIRPLSKQPLC